MKAPPFRAAPSVSFLSDMAVHDRDQQILFPGLLQICIHERQESGQSVRAWCRQNGIRENSYYYWLRIIREEALRETENRSGVLVRVEPEKLTVETASSQPTSERIVIRTHGVEAEI